MEIFICAYWHWHLTETFSYQSIITKKTTWITHNRLYLHYAIFDKLISLYWKRMFYTGTYVCVSIFDRIMTRKQWSERPNNTWTNEYNLFTLFIKVWVLFWIDYVYFLLRLTSFEHNVPLHMYLENCSIA